MRLRTAASTTNVLISDSALKVVFLTTLYVDVKEPAVRYILPQKKPSFAPTKLQFTSLEAPFSLPGQN
jgi:hypothetical protein